MGNKAKYSTDAEKKAAKAQKRKEDPKRKAYQAEYQRRKKEQWRLQQHPDPLALLANDEAQRRMCDELERRVVEPRLTTILPRNTTYS
jgi:hypothetical protein